MPDRTFILCRAELPQTTLIRLVPDTTCLEELRHLLYGMARNSGPKAKRNKFISLSPAVAHTVRVLQDVNRATLLSLPVEILIYVMSYTPDVGALYLDYLNKELLPADYFVLSDVLRALSQTCCRLRDVFLPVLWERMDVCASRLGFLHRLPAVNTASLLDKRCRGLLKNKELASYVK